MSSVNNLTDVVCINCYSQLSLYNSELALIVVHFLSFMSVKYDTTQRHLLNIPYHDINGSFSIVWNYIVNDDSNHQITKQTTRNLYIYKYCPLCTRWTVL